MNKKKPEYDGQFPGVDPIPEPDRPDQAATDKLDDLVLGVLKTKMNRKSISIPIRKITINFAKSKTSLASI